MAVNHAQPGEVVNVRPLGDEISAAKTTALFKTTAMEVVRLVMKTGKSLAEHRAPGEIVVHCLEGKIVFHTMGKSTELEAGQLLYLSAGEPHSVDCIENASFLLTIVHVNR